MSSPQTLLEAALEYANRGWPVFPCNVNNKRPLTKHGFKNATCDSTQISEWWDGKQSLIGLATGNNSNILAIDCDNQDAFEWLTNLFSEHSLDIQSTLIQKTPRGYHCLFKDNPAIRNSTSKLYPNIDVRGNGGYIIIAPSKSSNGIYEWLNNNEPQTLPDWLVELLIKKPPKKAPVKPANIPFSRYGEKALINEIDAILSSEEGSRNDQLNRSSYAIAQLVGGGEIELEYAKGMLIDAGVKIGLPIIEATKTVDSAFNSGLLQPRQKPTNSDTKEEDIFSVPLTDSELLAKAKKAKNKKQFVSLFHNGDITQYSTREEALIELAQLLAFWSGKDKTQIDRLMRQSALLEEPEYLTEWNNIQEQDKSYGELIIEKAINNTKTVYTKKKPDTVISDKIKIIYRQGELPRLIKELEESITGYAWQMDKVIVHVTRLPANRSYHGLKQPAGLSIISAFDKTSLSLLANEKADWVKQKINKNGELEYEYKINPSIDVISCYLSAYGKWKLPQITGLVTCPIMRPDGSILDKPGYDEITGLYADFEPKNFFTVEENPSKNLAQKALDFLKDSISEFPFKTEVDRAVALAGILTAVMRPSVAHAPLFAFSAPTPGTGKSTLADLIGIIATGKPCSAMDYNNDEAEFKKAVFATLLEGPPVVLIDNCVGEVNSSLLNMVLSQESIKGRILGLSKNANLPIISLWLATGNNLTIVGDLTRRTLFCTLDAGIEAPAKRQFKRNLYQWAENHRGELVCAALTILRAFHCADCQQDMVPMNGFNKWSKLVRGAILWLGEADPIDSQQEIEAHDPEKEGLRTVFNAWFEHFGSQFVTTKDLLNRTPPKGDFDIPDSQQALYQALLDVIPHGRELTSRLLGKWLARYNGRVVDRLKLINTGQTYQKYTYWKIVKC